MFSIKFEFYAYPYSSTFFRPIAINGSQQIGNFIIDIFGVCQGSCHPSTLMPFFFILSLRQVGHLISRVIRISLFYQNSTYFVSAYFLKHHRMFNSSDHRYSIKHFNTFLNPSMRKSYKQWLIYAYHRETGEIVAYVWGKRHLATVQRLKTKLKQLGIHYTRIASDHWDSFITAFKNCKQSIGKLFTVGIEGNNCKIRHRIRRGFRRSCNFSKKLENHFKAFDLTFFYINNGFI